MKTQYRFVKDFKVDGKPFRFIVDWSGQLILLNMTYLHDEFGDDLPLDWYRPEGAAFGAKVYRKTMRIALEAIFSLKLKHFWFSTGDEEIRYPLYKRIADRFLSKYGKYYSACFSGICFSFYRLQD